MFAASDAGRVLKMSDCEKIDRGMRMIKALRQDGTSAAISTIAGPGRQTHAVPRDGEQ